jgi:hypothetical protein
VDSEGKKSYTTDRSPAEALIMPTEFRGFAPRVGVLVHGDYSVKVKFCYPVPRPPVAEGFVLAAGAPPKLLPMPSLEEVLARKKAEAAKKEEERKKQFVIYQPPAQQGSGGPQRGRKKAGPTQRVVVISKEPPGGEKSQGDVELGVDEDD